MSSEWGMSSRGHWWVPFSGPGLQLPRCPLCPQGRSPSRLGGLCAVCCFVSPSLPPEQISASGSFHRVAFPTRPSVFFQFAFTLWIIVFFRLFLRVMTWFMPVLPLQPVSSTRTEIMSFLFLCPQSLEHSERGQVWAGSGYWVSSGGCCLGPGGVHEGGGRSRV